MCGERCKWKWKNNFGKTDTYIPALQKIKGKLAEKVGIHKAITGDMDYISQIEMVDQNPIGKSSRSNPVTYIKAYDEIRDLYSQAALK